MRTRSTTCWNMLMILLDGDSCVWSAMGSRTKYQERAVMALIHSTPSSIVRKPGSQRPLAGATTKAEKEQKAPRMKERIGRAAEGSPCRPKYPVANLQTVTAH